MERKLTDNFYPVNFYINAQLHNIFYSVLFTLSDRFLQYLITEGL